MSVSGHVSVSDTCRLNAAVAGVCGRPELVKVWRLMELLTADNLGLGERVT